MKPISLISLLVAFVGCGDPYVSVAQYGIEGSYIQAASDCSATSSEIANGTLSQNLTYELIGTKFTQMQKLGDDCYMTATGRFTDASATEFWVTMKTVDVPFKCLGLINDNNYDPPEVGKNYGYSYTKESVVLRLTGLVSKTCIALVKQ